MKAQLFTLLAAAAVGTGTVQARGEYAEIARLRSMNETVRGIRSMADGEHYTILEGNNIVRYGYATAGQGEQMLPKPTANLVVTDYAFSPDERQILIASGARPIYRHSYTTDYFLASGNSLMPVLREAEAPRDASFSPDGKLIAYSDRNDLYVYDTAGKRTRRITDDGAWNSVINGTTDWVYEEEFGFTRAYAFSPDSRRIAYLRFDESEVPLMEMMRFDGKLYNQAYSFKYPKAGERNSTVEVWVCDLATGTRERIDTGGETDQYIPRIGWTPDGRLYFFRLNRRQNTFEVILCEPNGAFAACVQTDLKYINAYSSVSHCGLVLFAILMMNTTAGTGAVLQMLSHGLMTALFFALIGMIYGRTHTRDVRELSGLMKVMPFLAVGYVIAGLANLGLPGLSGFVAEMTIFNGAFMDNDTFHRVVTIIACTSIVITAVYILRVVGKILYGTCTNEAHLRLSDATWDERLSVVCLVVAIAGMGLAPLWVSDMIRGSVSEIITHLMN